MPDNTYYDHITEAFKNIPAVAWLLVAIGILAGIKNVNEIVTTVRSWLGLKDKDQAQAEQQKKEFEQQKQQIAEEQGRRAALLALVEERGAAVTEKMQKVIAAVKSHSRRHPTRLQDQLRAFQELHRRHLEAIKNGDLVVQHDLNDEIHKVIEDFNRETSDRYGEIVKGWYDALPRKYLTAPFPGENSAYDSVGRDASELNKATEAIAKSIDYPRTPNGPSAAGPH